MKFEYVLVFFSCKIHKTNSYTITVRRESDFVLYKIACE